MKLPFSRTQCLVCSQWIPYVMLGLVAVAAGMVVGVTGARLERQRSELAALRQRLGEQHALMERFEQRAAAVRNEIVAWRAVHHRMFEVFGPDTGKRRAGTGVGGGRPVADAPAESATPQAQGELELLAASVAEEGPRLLELERVVERTGKMMNALPLRWPVRGPVNSEFGRRSSPWGGETEQHEGIDIGSPAGTPVRSPAAATVMAATSGGGYGNHVTLNHGNGVRSLYGHLERVNVKTGERVAKGQVIGLVGSTGRSTGPHLHYEIRVSGERVNPRGFLWQP
jgi:murein DD-endopeptidase MepM/ murein hydrolase activator NlpD